VARLYYPARISASIFFLTGAFAVGVALGTNARSVSTTYQLGDDFSPIKDAHQIAFGACAIGSATAVLMFLTTLSFLLQRPDGNQPVAFPHSPRFLASSCSKMSYGQNIQMR